MKTRWFQSYSDSNGGYATLGEWFNFPGPRAAYPHNHKRENVVVSYTPSTEGLGSIKMTARDGQVIRGPLRNSLAPS